MDRASFEEYFTPEPNTGCWLWLGADDGRPNGYGNARYEGRIRKAHIVAYLLYRGAIPKGLRLDHRCLVKACVNPDHLEPVTHQVNVVRGLKVVRARASTACSNGHAWTAASTYWHPTQKCRVCRICSAAAARRYLHRKKGG